MIPRAPEGEMGVVTESGTALSSEHAPSDPAPAETPASPAAPAAVMGSELTGKLFDPTTGNLRDNYAEVAAANGLEGAVGFMGRDGFGGSLDNVLKGALNLVPLSGKKVEQWGDAEIGALSDTERQAMLSKLSPIPADAGGYEFEAIEAFKDAELPEGFAGHWGEAAHAAGLTQEQLAILAGANAKWNEGQNEAAQALSAQNSQQNAAAITEHFQKEWGTDYGANKTAVEVWAEHNLDADDPATQVLLQSKTGLDMIYRIAKAEAAGRAEGKIPGNDPNVSFGHGDEQEFDDFIAKNPDWVNSTNPELVAEGRRLRDTAFRSNERRKG